MSEQDGNDLQRVKRSRRKIAPENDIHPLEVMT